MTYIAIRIRREECMRSYSTETAGPIEGYIFTRFSKRIRALEERGHIEYWGFYTNPVGNVSGNLSDLSTFLDKYDKK
jgi:hypothetical protein